MPSVTFDDDKIRDNDRPYKFPVKAWSRYVTLDKDATVEDVHFAQGIGMVICSMPYEGACSFCADGDEPRKRFANNVFIYNTTQQGAPLNPLSGHLEWISYDTSAFLYLKQARLMYPDGDLRRHDILFYCEKETYQTGQKNVAPEAWWLQDPNFRKYVSDEYQRMGIKDLSRKIGRKLTYAKQIELRQKLANRGGGGQVQGPGQGPGTGGFNPAGAAAHAAAAAGARPVFAPPMTVPAGGHPAPLDDVPFGQAGNQPAAPAAPATATKPAGDDLAELDAPSPPPPATNGGGGMADLDALLAENNK